MAKYKVLAEHSINLRGPKDLTKKSAVDMAAIFGVKTDVYSPLAVVDPKSETSNPSNGGVGGGFRE